MALRDMAVSLGFDINNSALDGVDSQMDDIADSAGDLDDAVSGSTSNMLDKLSGIGDGMKDIGGKMSAGVTAPVVGALTAVTKGTEDTQLSLGRLETNAEDAGIGAEKARDALTDLSGVTGDTDSNVEALSNLMATGMDEEGLNQSVEALSGAVTKFPDTLKMEGVADGMQETMATGKSVGMFGEMLERTGVNIDEFDKGLQKAKESGDEQQYVLDTLAKTGLADAADKFRENNEAVVESREASQEWSQTMADLGETLTPIMTAVTSAIADVVDWFNNLSPAAQRIIIIITGIAAAVGPMLGMLGIVLTTIPKMVTAFKTVSLFMKSSLIPTVWSFTTALLANPITWIVVGIMALIAVIVLLWRNWDQVTNFLTSAWDTIWGKAKEIFSAIGTAIADFAKGAWNIIKSIWTSVKDFFGTVLNAIWTLIKTIFISIFTTIQTILTNIWNFIKNIWTFIKTSISLALQLIWTAIKTMFMAQVNTIRTILTTAWNFIKWVWNTVKTFIIETVTSIWTTIKTWFQNIYIAIKGKLQNAWLFLTNIWNRIKTFISETVQKIWNKIKTKFGEIVTAIGDKMNEAWESIKDIWGKVEDFFANIDLMQTGKDIIQGLIDGILNMGDAAMDAAKGIAEDIKGSVLDFFGISSPSKLMIGYGEDIGMGKAIGIENTADDVEDASNELNQSVTYSSEDDDVSDDIVTAGSSGDTYHIEAPKYDIRMDGTASREDKEELKRMIRKTQDEWWESLGRRNPQVTEG